jgi:hypothetical protein
MNDNTIKRIVNVMYSDSHVKLDPIRVRSALQLDIDAGATEPNADEIDELIMGNDEGDVPEELASRYSNLNDYLNENF